MSTHRSRVLYATRKLLPYLTALVGEETSHSLRARLRELLQKRQAQAVDNLVIDLLSDHPPLRSWLNQALQGDPFTEQRYTSLPGGRQVTARTWVCPQAGCNFSWHIPKKGAPIPPCPLHQGPLIPKPKPSEGSPS